MYSYSKRRSICLWPIQVAAARFLSFKLFCELLKFFFELHDSFSVLCHLLSVFLVVEFRGTQLPLSQLKIFVRLQYLAIIVAFRDSSGLCFNVYLVEIPKSFKMDKIMLDHIHL